MRLAPHMTPPASAAPAISVGEFNALMQAEIPIAQFLGITAIAIENGTSLLRLPYTPAALRPGGVQCGPALMALADLAMYAAVMSMHGPDQRVLSSDLAMNFLRRAPDRDLIGRCMVLGIEPQRALVETRIAPEHDAASLVCIVTANYALPVR